MHSDETIGTRQICRTVGAQCADDDRQRTGAFHRGQYGPQKYFFVAIAVSSCIISIPNPQYGVDSYVVVDLKSEMERVREQVLNVE